MQIYGYDLPTTPNLNELQNSQNLFVFDDVISPATATAPTLKLVLTFSNHENSFIAPWYEQMNIIDAMNLLGYQSIWISNQELISIYGNVAEVIAKRATVQHFSNRKIGGENYKDEILLKMFDDLTLQNSRQFIVFHLMGTHMGYNQRYPSEFAKFNSDDLREKGLDKIHTKDAITLTNSQLKTRAEYANAVLYNDFVVSEIMQKFKDDEAIVFYFSDHADEVYDKDDFAGHNQPNRYSLEIPFMLYLSDKFKAAHPDIVAKVQAAQHKPFMTDNFIHALFDLLDIECVELDKTLSLFSDEFNATRPRIVGGRDYDKELKNPEFSFVVPDKIWLHRTDELKKVEDFYGAYQNFEIDIHYFDEKMAKNTGKNEPYFDVGHDGLKDTIGLDLREMLALIRQKDNEFKQKAPKIQVNSRIWLDFKNLTAENSAPALQKLIEITAQTDFKPENIIVESRTHEQLAAFKQAGFYTSYYVPYYDEKMLKTERERERERE